MLFFFLYFLISFVTTEYEPYYLCAPFSSFNSDLTLNLDGIAKQAKFCHQEGVNLAWVNGGLAQFQSLSLDERKIIAEHWVSEGKKYTDLEILVHVSDLCLENAKNLAKHAQDIGADYIAVLPPFYEKPGSIDVLVEWIKEIADTVDLGIFYYHIPGSTGVEINIYDFVVAADEKIPNFRGVKYVDTHDNIWQYQRAVAYKSGKYAKGMLWALEPKLMAMPFGARSIVLAEAYYAKYYREMTKLYAKLDMEKAFDMQQFLQEVHEIVSPGGNKNVLRGFGFDLGPNRLPHKDKSKEQIDKMLKELTDLGFFNTTMSWEKMYQRIKK